MTLLRAFSLTISSIMLAAMLTFFGSMPASATDGNGTCDLSGSGTAGSPWLLTSQNDFLEIGIGDCLPYYSHDQYYKLANDIQFTGNWTPVDLYSSPPQVASLDGDGHTIYGLQISTSANTVGLFRDIRSATVTNLNIEATSVAGGNYVGVLAGNVTESTIQNVIVRVSGNVSGSQMVGGVIGKAYNSTVSDIAFYSAGQVTGTDYCGGAIGSAEGSNVSKIYVKTDTNFSGIGGGVIGEFNPSADSTLWDLYFDGDAVADQYSAGLVGSLWSSSALNVTILYSAVVGSVSTKTNYEPAAYVGQVSGSVYGITVRANFTKAQFKKNTSTTPAVVATANGANGISGSVYYTDVGPSNFYVTTGGSSLISWSGSAVDVTNPTNLTPNWNPVVKTSWSATDGTVNRWVIDTSGVTNGGLPMPTYLYNAKFFQSWCSPGRYATDGFTNCTLAAAGKHVPYYGATAPIDCPAGTFQSNIGASECDPAPAGFFVANSASTEATPCPAGTYQSLTGQMVCLWTSAGHFTDQSASVSELPCPVGYYQPNTQSTSCLPAQAGYYVATTGSAAETQCPSGQTSNAAAASCFSTSTAYAGPIINSLVGKVRPGEKVTVSGSNLLSISRVLLGSEECEISHISNNAMQLVLPINASDGLQDLTVVSDFGTLQVQDFANVSSSISVQSLKSSIKRIGNKARIVTSNLIGVGKVQFMLNGKEIAWVNATSAADSKLRNANGASYLVRTVTLAAGKNVLEVYVDGKRILLRIAKK